MTEHSNYARVAKAIEYIEQNFKQQPSLAEIAEHVHLSPTHFQRIFSEWAGISPKKFLQYISVEYAKSVLKNHTENNIFAATFDTGLSSTSRLHDLFVQIEGMTPAEYKQGGEALHIHYSFAETIFGSVIIASTPKGICHMAFTEVDRDALAYLKKQFPRATFIEDQDELQRKALAIFQHDQNSLSEIKLHLKGTDFQLKVWQSLLKIPMGKLSSYAYIAQEIGQERASRAVGTAIGNNPVAFLIPCHRVIQSSGQRGNYMWGTTRKTAMIGWEGAHSQTPTEKESE